MMNFLCVSRVPGRRIFAVATMLTACTIAIPVFAQSGTKQRTEAVPKVQGAPVSPALAVTQLFTQRGVVKCAERVGQFAQFLTTGGQVSGQAFVAPEDVDRRIASASLEIQAGQAIAYAGLNFAPDAGANRCGGVYELVSYWPTTCEDVATKAFATFKRMPVLRESIMSLEGGPAVRVFLLPAGAGCVSIKKEIVF